MKRLHKQELKALFRAVPVPLLVITANPPEYTLADMNSAYLAITGRKREDLIGKKLLDVFPETDTQNAVQQADRLIESLETVISEKKTDQLGVLRYDIVNNETGRMEVRYWNSRNIPVFNDEGNVNFVLNTVTEITEQILSNKREEAALNEQQKAEKLLLEIQNVARVGAWEVDLKTNTLYWSKIAQELHETDNHFKPNPQTMLDFCKNKRDRDTVTRAINKLIEDGIPFDIEFEIVTAKGNERWVRSTGTAEQDTDGSVKRMYGSVQDVTKIKRSAIELEESRERLRTILDAEPDCVKVVSKEGTLLEINASGLDMIKSVTDEEVLGKAFPDFVHPDDLNIFHKHHEHVLSGGTDEVRFRMRTENDSEIWVESNSVPLKNSEGTVTSILSVTRDITDKLKTENDLIDSRNKFQSLVQSINGVVWESDAETFEFSYVSPSVEKILGYTPDEWLSEADFWENHIHPDDRDKVVQTCKSKTSKGNNHTFDYRMISKDGRDVWLRDIITVIKENGKPSLLRGVMFDITEQKKFHLFEQLEKKILEITAIKKTPLDEIIYQYLRGMEVIYPDMHCSLMKKEGNFLFDWSSPSLPPGYVEKIEGIEVGNNLASFCAAASLKKVVITGDIQNDPEWDDFQKEISTCGFKACYSQPLFNPDGKVVATFTVYYTEEKEPDRFDKKRIERVCNLIQLIIENRVTDKELKRVNSELEMRAKELARSNQELEKFAYAVAHDLQEPLRMVSKFAKRLEEKYGEHFDEKGKRYIDFAVDGAEQMRKMIVSLLNYSRMGSDDFEVREIHTGELIDDIIKLNRAVIQEANASIRYNNLPVVVGTYFPVFQLFYNLINNALKYHQPGSSPQIKIIANETETYWEFRVSDNGIGIPDRYKESVFDVFYRLHSRNEYEGTGIGLALCKKVVELHGGSIWIESEPELGTTVIFTISKQSEVDSDYETN
jgi:PAS domain S-box-containing protein